MRVLHIVACIVTLKLLLAALTSVTPASAAAAAEVTSGASRGVEPLRSLRTNRVHTGPLWHSATPSLDGSPVDYLIITNDDMAPEFERLAHWKTRKGVPAIVRTLDEVKRSALAGSDLAETLRNYIRDAYLYWGIEFVLLGGDTDVLPARYVAVDLLQLHRPPTELYYACLDGDWNADGDAAFGEVPEDAVDLRAEVFVGRAPVSSRSEARLFVDKTLAHEWPLDTTFQGRMLLMAEVLFPANWQSGGPPPTADGALYAEEISAVVPNHLERTRLYEASELWEGSEALSVASGRDAINSGYGAVVHIGHGYRYTLSLGDGSMNVPDAKELTNGARAGLFYMLNCTATAFDFDSMAEALLLNPDGGATLVVGASREAFPLAARGYQREFFAEVFERGERRVGAAMSRSREHILDTSPLTPVELWTQLVYTLLGDPEASVWSEARRDLRLTDVPEALEIGAQRLVLRVSNDDAPVERARVCVFKANDEYRVAHTNADGEAVLELQVGEAGEVLLTVNAIDHVPLQVTLPVQAPSVALGVVDNGLSDDGGDSGFGNRDGVLDAGETAGLTLPLRNAGAGAATAISATLVSEDAAVEVLQASSAYADLTSGEQGVAQTPFEVRVDATTGDGSVAHLRLDVQHSGGFEGHRIELLVAAARLQLRDVQIDDRRAGNGNGRFDPGEEVDLHYSVMNRGSGAATAVQLHITQASHGLIVLSDVAEFAEIPRGETRQSSSALVIRDADGTLSHTARLLLVHRGNAAGRAHPFETRHPGAPQSVAFGSVGAPDAINLEWQPNREADLLGYNVYRSLTEAGPFERINTDIVLHSYFRDTGLSASTRYHYRVTALDAALFEGPPSVATAASTNPPQLAGWPLDLDDFSASTPVVGDVLGRGEAAIVAASRQLFAWDGRGVELRDADNNALTWGVFFGDREVYGSVTLADMDAHAGREIVVSTWDPTRRFVVVVNGRGETLPGWPRNLVPSSEALRGSLVPPVVVNLDAHHAPEVLLAARDGRLYGWHADGTEIADGDRDPSTHGVLLNTGSPFLRCAPGVADLDPNRPGLEIAIGSTDGKLYVVGADGEVLPGWPRTTDGDGAPFGARFASGIAVADLDRDGVLEMVFLESGGRLHAMHMDGGELGGFPIDGLRSSGNSVTPSVAIGDLLGGSELEVVAATSDGELQVFDAQGNALLSQRIVSGAGSESSPILGDVDGDGEIEIVFGNESGLLHAWNLDATPVDGFPVALGSEIRATPVLADVHGNGRAALVVQAWSGLMSVLDLGVPWDAGRFPWPMHRGNLHRTGEFGFQVSTAVGLSDVAATPLSDGRVVLSWRPPGDDAEHTWSVRRAGPMLAAPSAAAQQRARVVEIGRVHGEGTLRYEDRPPLPARWYVYAIASSCADADDFVERARFSLRAAAPATLRFHPAAPNPFNPATRLTFELPEVPATGSPGQRVRIDVFDAHGRRVRTLVNQPHAAGRYSVEWNGRDGDERDVPSGVYVAQLRVGRALRSQKLVLLR